MRSAIMPNDRVHSIDEIARIVSPIAKEFGVEKVYLFGSYARGDATPDSDIDFFIESGRIDDYFGIGRLYCRLNRALEKDLDIVPSDAGSSFIDKIRPDLVLVYAE